MSEPTLCGWPCSGAQQTLAESVSSLSANAVAHGRSARFLVCVDREEAVDDARMLLADISPDTKTRVIGLTERRRFLDLLPPFIDRDAASFALIPDEGRKGPGYNRNFLLLAAAGGNLVMTDDDIICDTVVSRDTKVSHDAARSQPTNPAPTIPAHPTFTSEPFPVPLRFFTDRERALASVRSIDVDVIGRHRALLGSSVEGHAGEVVLTCAGSYGDSGLGRARTVLSLTGKARDDSFAAGYKRIRYSRELVRMPETDLVGPSMFFMAGHGGYDAREVLPPFFPFVGNEDGFFAMLVRSCRTKSLTAYPSFALFHDPPSPRAFRPDSIMNVTPTVTDLMMASLVTCMEVGLPADSRTRLTSIGNGYVALASLKSVDFVEAIHAAWSRGATAYVQLLESLLERYGREPAPWASDIDATLDRTHELLREPALIFGPSGCGQSPDALRDLMSSYGRTLEQWPDVFDFARENREFFGLLFA